MGEETNVKSDEKRKKGPSLYAEPKIKTLFPNLIPIFFFRSEPAPGKHN